MSRPLYVMRERFERLRSIRGAHSRRCPPRVGSSSIRVNRSLTVPLLCSLRWCGFQVEGAYQIEGGITQGQAFDTGPQVDDVAFLATGGVEAVEDALLQMHAEGTATGVATVERAGATTLGSAAAQA